MAEAQTGKRILIIEDEEDLNEMIQVRLKANGFDAQGALDGKSGLQKAKAMLPDVIVLDLMMPVMSGYEVCKALQDNPLTRPIPILILSARNNPQEQTKCQNIGAKAFLSKPFEAKELIDCIKKISRP